MPTTNSLLNLPLRDRNTLAVSVQNQSPHSFVAAALVQKVDEAEWRPGMQHEAQKRDIALLAGEPGVEWSELKTYLRARLRSRRGYHLRFGSSQPTQTGRPAAVTERLHQAM